MTPQERKQREESLRRLEALLSEKGHSPIEVDAWTKGAQQLRGELGMEDAPKAPITKAEVINMIRNLRKREGITNPKDIAARIKQLYNAPKKLHFDVPPGQATAPQTTRPVPGPTVQKKPAFKMPPEAEALIKASSQPGIPPGSRIIAGHGAAGGQIVMPPVGQGKPTFEGAPVPEQLKQIPGAAGAASQAFESPMTGFSKPGERVPNLPSGQPAGGPPEITPPVQSNLISDLVEGMISPGRMGTGELDLRPLADTLNSVILGSAGRGVGAAALEEALSSPMLQQIVARSPLAQKIMGFALHNERITRFGGMVGEDIGASIPFIAKDIMEAPDTQTAFKESLQTLGGFFALDIAMRGAFQGLSRIYKDFAPYTAMRPIQEAAENRAIEIIDTAQANAAKQGRKLTPEERGAVLRYAAHAAASRLDEMVSPEFAEAYRQQLRLQLRTLMQQAEKMGESPNTTFEVIQSILDARARNVNSAVQESIRILDNSGLMKDVKVAAKDIKKTGKKVASKVKGAAKTVSAEGTMQPSGAPFVYTPGATPAESAAATEAAVTSEKAVVDRAKMKAEADAAFAAAKDARPKVEAPPEPPKKVPTVVTDDTVITPEKEAAIAAEKVEPQTVRQEADEIVQNIQKGKRPRRTKTEAMLLKAIGTETPYELGVARASEKIDRLTLLKQRAAAIKSKSKAMPERQAIEEAIVKESQPTAAEFKQDEELYAEILDSQSNRPIVDPLHSRTLKDFAMKPTRTGPATTLGQVRIFADTLGYEGPTALRTNDGNLEYVLKPKIDGPRASEEPIKTRALSDMMAELQRKSGAFLGGEVANQTLLADSPDDEEDVRKMKTGLRTAIRMGTIGVLLGSAMPRNSVRSFGNKAAQIARSILTGLPVGSPNAGIWRRQAAELERVSNDIQHLWFGMRNPKEIIRNWPEALKKPIMEVDSAVRAMGKELEGWDHRLGTEAPRAGIGEKSDASKWAYDIMEGIDSDLVVKIANPRNKQSWLRAIAETYNRRPDEMADATIRAVDAIEAMPERLLPWPKEFVSGLRDLRERSATNFVEKFRATEGAEKPFLVLDEQGNAVRRTSTGTKAQQIIDRAAKKGKMGWTMQESVDPTPGEIEDRIGRTVSNYVTRLSHGLLEHDMRVEELVDNAPWANPVVMLDEMKRMLRIGNKTARREAFEDAFGVMDDEAYREFVKTALKVTQSGGSVTGFKGAAAIPEEIYVRFYRNRKRSYDYERDAVKAMRTYTRSVLRDLYLDKHLPAFDASVDAMVAQVQAGKLSPAAVMQVVNYAEDVFKKNRSGTLPFAQTVGTMTNAMHAALLWARAKPAINNFIGQTFLVGIPQELGEGYGDVMTTASIAMWSPTVRRLLQQHDIIREAMPRGYRQFSEILGNFSKMETGREKFGAGWDATKKALDFITTYTEVPIRTQSFLFGFLKHLKDNKAVLREIPGLGLNAPATASLDDILKAVLAHRDLIPEDVWHGALKSGEEWVGRNAFFFEHESQPAILRAAKRIPGVGQPLTFLSNFPTTYMNRYVSTLLDAFGRNVPGSIRRKAMGTMITHFALTMMIAGPAGFPLYSAFLQNAAEEDPELPGKARRFLAPYANFFATLFGHDLVKQIPGVGPTWGRRDLSVYGSTQPFTEFFNPRRYTDATIARPFLDAAKTLDIWADPQEAEEAKLRTFGWFSPAFGGPPPEQNLVPEALTTFAPGGTAANDVLNLWLGLANSGLPGPLDTRHKLKGTTNPLEKFLFGPSAEDRENRARVQTGMRAKSEDERRMNRFVNALVNPRLLGTETGKKEFETSMNLIKERPQLIQSVMSGDRIQNAIRDMKQTPDVRMYFSLPRATLERIVTGTKDFPEGARILLKGIEKLPPDEQERRRRKFAAIMLAYAGGEAPPATGQ